MKKEKVIIHSGVPRKTIEEWLATTAIKEAADTWAGEGWNVELGPQQEIPTGPFFLPRTTVIFSGEPEACQTITGAFRLRFLSAGG